VQVLLNPRRFAARHIHVVAGFCCRRQQNPATTKCFDELPAAAKPQTFGETACHPERSEGSGSPDAEILRFAQDDSVRKGPTLVPLAQTPRSFASLRMTSRTTLKSAHGKSYLQISGKTLPQRNVLTSCLRQQNPATTNLFTSCLRQCYHFLKRI
jgi:hypothetical protein